MVLIEIVTNVKMVMFLYKMNVKKLILVIVLFTKLQTLVKNVSNFITLPMNVALMLIL